MGYPTLEVTTETIYNLEIESSSSQILEINTGFVVNVVYATDIIGLDDYLSNFIDNYEIDCGTP
jgi:hypothetical protein